MHFLRDCYFRPGYNFFLSFLTTTHFLWETCIERKKVHFLKFLLAEVCEFAGRENNKYISAESRVDVNEKNGGAPQDLFYVLPGKWIITERHRPSCTLQWMEEVQQSMRVLLENMKKSSSRSKTGPDDGTRFMFKLRGQEQLLLSSQRRVSWSLKSAHGFLHIHKKSLFDGKRA